MPDGVTVVVDDAQLAEIDELADRLRDAGMRIDQVLGEIGVISGSLAPEHRDGVRAMAGVAGVEAETTFRPRRDTDPG